MPNQQSDRQDRTSTQKNVRPGGSPNDPDRNRLNSDYDKLEQSRSMSQKPEGLQPDSPQESDITRDEQQNPTRTGSDRQNQSSPDQRQ